MRGSHKGFKEPAIEEKEGRITQQQDSLEGAAE